MSSLLHGPKHNSAGITAAAENDLVQMLVGKQIGSGCYRRVFEHKLDDSLVIKIEEEAGNFANIHEWEVWVQFQYGPWSLKKFFAPCTYISPNGIILFQKKTSRIRDMKFLPKKVPGFMTDLHFNNWGMYEKRAVCHDYGNLLIGRGSKLKKVNWHKPRSWN